MRIVSSKSLVLTPPPSLTNMWNADSNLYYYRARWYDPQAGRFISEDPIGLAGGINLYAYVGNNPTGFIDPSGLDGEEPGFFRLQAAYWKGVGKGAVNTVAGTPGFVYRLVTHPVDTLKSVYDDVSGRIKTLYEIIRHPGEGLNAIRDAIAEVGPEESMEILGDSSGQVLAFKFFADMQRWIREAKNCRIAQEIGILREAASGKGNFGVGSASQSTAIRLGRAWVGDGYTVASDGKTLLSADKLRQFRPPSFKPNLGRFQANLESRWTPSGQWQTNGHLDILP